MFCATACLNLSSNSDTLNIKTCLCGRRRHCCLDVLSLVAPMWNTSCVKMSFMSYGRNRFTLTFRLTLFNQFISNYKMYIFDTRGQGDSRYDKKYVVQ